MSVIKANPSGYSTQLGASEDIMSRIRTTLRTRVTGLRRSGILQYLLTGNITSEKLSTVFYARSRENLGSILSLGKEGREL